MLRSQVNKDIEKEIDDKEDLKIRSYIKKVVKKLQNAFEEEVKRKKLYCRKEKCT